MKIKLKEKIPFNPVWENVKKATGFESQKDLSGFLGINSTAVSKQNRLGVFLVEWVFKIAQEYDLSIDWLLTGEGSMKRREPELEQGSSLNLDQSPIYVLQKSLENIADAIIKNNDKLNSLITMTKKVLQSRTIYSASLAVNIESSYRAVDLENKLMETEKIKKHDERIAALEAQLQERKKGD